MTNQDETVTCQCREFPMADGEADCPNHIDVEHAAPGWGIGSAHMGEARDADPGYHPLGQMGEHHESDAAW